MVESKNIDDFELDDDLEGQWDDSIDEEIEDIDDALSENEDDAKSTDNSKKKKNLLKLLIALIILGSGGYLFLPFVMPKEAVKPIAVVKIDNSQDVSVNEVNSIEVEKIEEDEVLVEAALQVQEDNSFEVLTPMPEDIADEAMPISDLMSSLREASVESVDKKLPPATEELQQELLSEDDFLSKTEAIFDDNLLENNTQDSVNIEETVTIITPEEIQEVSPSDSIYNELANLINEVPEDKVIEPKLEQESKILPKAVAEEVIAIPEVKIVPPLKKIEESKIIEEIKLEPKKIVVPPKKVVKVSKKKKPVWVIRAAQSGSAIIYDKTSREMKSIEVNDVVNGIGRIKSIKIVNGAWVIIGSLGRVEQ